jgi:RecA/RadA recombinase
MADLDFVRNMQKKIKDEFTSVLDDGETSAQYTSFIDTGSYALNALLSGSIYGGMADNKVIALAGESSVGKTYFKLAIEKHFMELFPGSFTLDYDTESATTKEMMTSRGIDPKRVIVSEPESIQKFRTHCVKFIDEYSKMADRPRCLVSLDSLGNLSTDKEIADMGGGSDKRDMTRSGLIRGAFRVLRLKLAKANIPMIVTNHTYDVVGAYVPTKEMSGGGGLKYAADVICYLSKKKDRDATDTKDVKGNIITITLHKSRLTIENKKVSVRLSYQTGLDRYYGLLDIALKHGIFVKLAKGIEIAGKRVYEKELDAHPELYYTPEVLAKLDEACKKEFLYGGNVGEEQYEEDTEESAE